MQTAPTENRQSQADGVSSADPCPECRIYNGAHRLSCSQLDRANPAAMEIARGVESYLRAHGR